MQQFNRREKYHVANTLSCVPLILQGQSVLIDLLNETSVAGRIVNADGVMNIHLEKAVYIDRNGAQYAFAEFMVRSRLVRQIHIPGHIDMQMELQKWFTHGLKNRRPKLQKSGKRTFKQKRAEERHKEIVQQITETKKDET